jgi:hypothetical protein
MVTVGAVNASVSIAALVVVSVKGHSWADRAAGYTVIIAFIIANITACCVYTAVCIAIKV